MTQPHKDHRQIVLGVCSMEKKANSKPMHEILDRITKHFPKITALIFDEHILMNEPVSRWPVCDVLISFHSRGFPQHKVIEYSKLRQPYMINELESQYILLDRRAVYEILHREGIPHPRYAIVDRDKDGQIADLCNHDEDESSNAESSSNADEVADMDQSNAVETDDSIEIGGVVFTKPFVEKPVNAENHNIVIYFPQSAGGGSQRLFRKVDNKASTYSCCSQVRRIGSYLYEEFMPTDGTDVKVYTVGPEYTHAEARKAPALDGVVERDADGKEVRYPVILSGREKLIARAIVRAFKQLICGFDLLRANGRSYVCDVNGFSFVKTSKKYYDDCSNILGTLIMRHAESVNLCLPLPVMPAGSFAPSKLCGTVVVTTQPEPVTSTESTSADTTSQTTYLRPNGSQSCLRRDSMELRCLIAVVRHGDRTPKQKCKVLVSSRCFFELFEKHGGMDKGKVKLKKPTQLQAVLDLIRTLLAEEAPPAEVVTNRTKFEQIKSVLEMHGHFSGINRKVQFKLTGRTASPSPSNSSGEACAKSLLLIVKWGGELTKWGKEQALGLGKELRSLYPGGDGVYSTERGLGLLRLHSTFRHDLKIYASDEGRVQMTAAAFAKGFLALEGELPPILVQMVKSGNTNGLLDNEGDAQTLALQRAVRARLQQLINRDVSLTEPAECTEYAPTGAKSLLKACASIGNPRGMCTRVRTLIGELLERIKQLAAAQPQVRLYHGESIDLTLRRWMKLQKEFCKSETEFETSKIPDVYDNVKYDYQHNQAMLQFENMPELYTHAKSLADLIVPQEYGITKTEKLQIALAIGSPLLRKILADLRWADADATDESTTRLNTNLAQEQVSSPDRFVRTRLYFTSESHLISLFTCLRYGDLFEPTSGASSSDAQWSRAIEFMAAVPELNYLSQIVFMVYENPLADAHSEDRFGVEVHFSSGAELLHVDRDEPNSHDDAISMHLDSSRGNMARSISRSSLDENVLNDDRPSTSSCTSTQVLSNLRPLVPSTSMSYLLSSQPSLASHADLTELSMNEHRNAAAVLPLAPLHNALSLRCLEVFLERLVARLSPTGSFVLPLQSFQLPTMCCTHPNCYCEPGSLIQQLCPAFQAHKRTGDYVAPSQGSPDVSILNVQSHGQPSSPRVPKTNVAHSFDSGSPRTLKLMSSSPTFSGQFLSSSGLQSGGPIVCSSSATYLQRMRMLAEALVEHDFLAYCEKVKSKADKSKKLCAKANEAVATTAAEHS